MFKIFKCSPYFLNIFKQIFLAVNAEQDWFISRRRVFIQCFLAVYWSAVHKAFPFHWDLLPIGWKDLQIVRQLYSSDVCQQRLNPSHGTVSLWLHLSKKRMNRNMANYLIHIQYVLTSICLGFSPSSRMANSFSSSSLRALISLLSSWLGIFYANKTWNVQNISCFYVFF